MTVHASPKPRPFVVHLSGDFPDPIEPFKTPVIRSFLELSSHRFDHYVVSINRTAPRLHALPSLVLARSTAEPSFCSTPFEHGVALAYVAPGRGILHRTRLDLLGDWLAAQIRQLPRRPDLLMAHKLTIEGIAIQRAARILGLPYALTIQGNTDRRILAARPDLRGLFRSIYLGAEQVMTFTPIAQRAIEEKLGRRPDGITLVPCPTELDSPIAPRFDGNGLITVFHLKNHKVKNLQGMAHAINSGSPKDNAPKLAVIGGGSDAELLRCQAITSACPTIAYEGPLDRRDVSQRMNRATALVQPSLSESFGLVFVEALFSGLPIIYPAGTGIDGYFEGAEFALRADPHSPTSILAAMQKALRYERQMKQALAEWQNSSAANRFTRTAIADTFAQVIDNALASTNPVAAR